MKKIIWLLPIALLLACKVEKNKPESIVVVEEIVTNDTIQEKPQKPYQVTARMGKFPESDDLQIDTAYVIGNSLHLNVKYGGGCKLHQFEFIGEPDVIKTLPPKRSVQLIHDNGDDMCKALVSQQIEVDIKEMSHNKKVGDSIVLLLSNYKYPLTYIYE